MTSAAETPLAAPPADAGMAPEAVAAWRIMRDVTHHPDVLRRGHVLAEELGVTPSVVKALRVLRRDRPTPMRDLAGALHCDTSYVTTVVDSLEQQGLAERQPHPTDRRVKVVALTPKGETLAVQVRANLDHPPAVFATLSDEEARSLLGLLSRLAP